MQRTFTEKIVMLAEYSMYIHRVLFSEKVLILNWLSATTGCVITSLWKRSLTVRVIQLLDKQKSHATPDIGGYFPRRDTWLSETHLDDKIIPDIYRYFQTDFWSNQRNCR